MKDIYIDRQDAGIDKHSGEGENYWVYKNISDSSSDWDSVRTNNEQTTISLQKDPPYRNEKLRRAVATLPCQLCGLDGSTQASHSNQSRDGRGIGHKTHDYRLAALCFKCHYDVDYGKESREAKLAMWEKAHRATIGQLFKLGLVDVV